MKFLCLLSFAAIAVVSIGAVDLSKDGVSITVEPNPERVDVARDFEVTVTAVAPAGTTLAMPDLRDRFGGKIARAAIVTAEKGGAAMRNRASELGIDVFDLDDLNNILNRHFDKRLRNLIRAAD
jgi:hypothetical protein